MKINVKLSYAVISLISVLVFSGCGIQSKKPNGSAIRFEHIALNVKDPVAVANWYCTHMDMKIRRKCDPPFNTRFVSDKEGNMMFEFYHNADAPVLDYSKVQAGSMHIAFVVDDVESVLDRLQRAGATLEQRAQKTSQGDIISMLRDPWGIPIQILRRIHGMLENP